jgi:two-component system, OmpR family, sensor histidine kinase MprB
VAVGGIALAALLGFAVTRTALTPVRKLTEATERVTETGDLRQGIEATGSDEISRLAASFNRMLEALDASLGAQRQLVADASHELRTPLTSLRTNVEVLARGSELPQEDQVRLVRDTVAQLDEMTALIADLVDLARDSGPHHEARVDVRLDELASRALERAEGRLPSVRFVADLHPSLVRGIPDRLERAVANLLDNAAKWSAPGGMVEMSLRDGDLVVRDHGPGIAPEDLPRVFDRFYRAASARGLPGSGLGLAIVKQVAESHGGDVVAWNAEDGGAVVRLRLPGTPSVTAAPAGPDPASSPQT